MVPRLRSCCFTGACRPLAEHLLLPTQALGSYLAVGSILSARQVCRSWRDGLGEVILELLLDSQNLDAARLAAFKRAVKRVFPKARRLTLDVGCSLPLTEEQAAEHARALVSVCAAYARQGADPHATAHSLARRAPRPGLSPGIIGYDQADLDPERARMLGNHSRAVPPSSHPTARSPLKTDAPACPCSERYSPPWRRARRSHS